MGLDRLFGRRTQSVPKEAPGKILPSDVRYALQYRGAELRKTELEDLARNGFVNEALYLSLKMLADSPEAQKSLLAKIQGGVLAGRDSEQEIALTAVNDLPTEKTVASMKLGQLSRQGFEHWQKLYTEAALRLAKDSRETFVAGNAMFLGIAPFIRAHASEGKSLSVLMPSFFDNAEIPAAGYHIRPDAVDFLPKDFERPEHAVVVDDVIDTGTAKTVLNEFWIEHGKYPSPDFEFLSTTTTDG